MASMNVSVPDAMRDWVRSRIENGHYANESDYVRDLIRRDQNVSRKLTVDEIRRSIEESRVSGKTVSADLAFAGIEDQLREMTG